MRQSDFFYLANINISNDSSFALVTATLSTLIASWHAMLRDAILQERWHIFNAYMIVLCVVAFLIAAGVHSSIDGQSMQHDRYGILRYTEAVALAIFLGIIGLGFAGAYIVIPSLTAGLYLSPTCAVRRVREGGGALFCTLGRLAGWTWRFSIGKRGAELGEFEPFWESLIVFCAFPVVGLILLLVPPDAYNSPMKRAGEGKESKGTQT